MFSDLILRNSRRSRKENGLFFSSLVISIVAFYLILSISQQDVMVFLRKMESDAVDKLMLMIPVFYVMTLGILFFLIYFASKYQLQRRRHEFGVYLMMGMQRSKLFTMLLAEDVVSSLFALLIGLPVAVLLSEVISLVTAKLVGMGIVVHQFSLSVPALIFTIGGFLVIKLAAFLILSGKISRQEIGELLSEAPSGTKKERARRVYVLSAVGGILMLAAAYTMAIRGTAWQRPGMMFVTQLLGVFGTILLFYGMRVILDLLIRAGKSNQKLRVFNFRQIQENVIHQSTTMAISSLLILAALCCFGAGIGIASTNRQAADHVLDYTFDHYGDTPSHEIFSKVQGMLKEKGLDEKFEHLFPMRLGNIRTTDEYEGVFVMEPVMDAIEQMPQSRATEILLNNLSYTDKPYVICLSDYNKLLSLAGKPTLKLDRNEAAIYIASDFIDEERTDILNGILATHPLAELDGAPLYLTGEVQSTNLITDRAITLSFALILPDNQFFYYTQDKYSVYVNGVLNENITKELGLMNAISAVNEQLATIDFESQSFRYESYLQNMGRQLFFMVAASYITMYLAIIFLVVANTIVGVQFLMGQQKNGRRYRTLVRLGATYEVLCASARKQIRWFMGLPIVVAAVSSLLGVKALFAGILSSWARGTQGEMLVVSGAMICLLLVVECLYITAVKRSSDRYLLTLMEPQREE